MTGTGRFCPGCGSPRDPSSKFCKHCGTGFDGESSLEQAARAGREIADAAKTVESAAGTGTAAVRAAGEVKEFVIAPPARWKVVIGDRLPGAGEAAMEKAADSVMQKAGGSVAGELEKAAHDVLARPQASDGTARAQPPAPENQGCPVCRSPVNAGVKFCGSCGAPIGPARKQEAPSCPHCGSPVRPGVKFCGSCGQKTA